MGHGHDHGAANVGDRRLIIALLINVLLTVAQVIGGIISGSLSLIADALHNLSDAATLGIAVLGRIIGRKPADKFNTFGYQRAETVAALINLVTLIIVGFYLIYEALWRIVKPEAIEGWAVVIVAGIALAIDVATAILTYVMSKESANIKVAFLHNVSDALASVGVIIAGTLILLYDWYWVDTLLTLLIASYVLWQGYSMLPPTINLLMEGTPENISIEEVITNLKAIQSVDNIHHVHIWQINEHHKALEAHVSTYLSQPDELEQLKAKIKGILCDQFDISHSTLEFEYSSLTKSSINSDELPTAKLPNSGLPASD